MNTKERPADPLVAALQGAVSGDVRCDPLARAMFAVDASIYEIIPDVVVSPKTVDDIRATVRICGEHKVPLTARGAGTGLTGGAVNRGVILDCSRYMKRVDQFDPQKRTVYVEPGVVLDELNAELRPHGLHFSPDVATSSRATIGGMIGNNSAGAHSILYGRTSDHVLSVDVVLSDGSLVTWGVDTPPTDNPLAQRCEQTLREVVAEQRAEIDARYPKIMRKNGGYALDRLRDDNGRLNVETLMVGQEGTLGIVVGATIDLTPLAKHKGLVVVHYDDLLKSLASVPTLLEHQPAAIELVDKFILDGTRHNPAMQRRRRFLSGDPEAILAVELFDDDEAKLRERLATLVADLQAKQIGYAWPILATVDEQNDVWEVRKGGTGLLMSNPGDRQPYDFVDDCAVDPARLHEYIARLQKILVEEGVERVGYYAHASVGLLHVRPVLNLKTREDIVRLRRIGERVCGLVAEFEGAMTGEHGDGLVRSEWVERMFGPRLFGAFRRIKSAFDPHGVLNPGKIVDPLPMDTNLRYGDGYQTNRPLTVLDFSAHGGPAGLAEMCSGIGQCRQKLVGTMCPSYQATGDEQHTTRARANALREALSNHGLLEGFDDPALEQAFDLCLSCKACKTECPTGTDIAKLKAEWLHAHNQRHGVPKRSRLIARSIEMAAWGSRFAPLSNWLMQNPVTRAMMEHWFGLDRRVPPPKFARQTFRDWFRKRKPADNKSNEGRPRVVYFVDTWVNYYTPEVGQATVKVLEAMGYEVVVPGTVCCGRPLISKGLLDEAKELATANVAILAPLAEEGLPIVGTEPSCVSAMLDEWPQLAVGAGAEAVKARSQTVEGFIAAVLRERPDALRLNPQHKRVLYHGHCHQKALFGTADALSVLSGCTCDGAREIDSGCCGMAGSFGHEVEHYEVARLVGEQRLFPAIRARDGADILVSGFSCRHQIAHHTDARPRHVVEFLADGLA